MNPTFFFTLFSVAIRKHKITYVVHFGADTVLFYSAVVVIFLSKRRLMLTDQYDTFKMLLTNNFLWGSKHLSVF